MGAPGSKEGALLTEINVTPLVDVVLVLLVVLMVTATAVASQTIPVQLPHAKTGESSPSEAPLAFPERHLGLHAADQSVSEAQLDAWSRLLEEWMRVEALLEGDADAVTRVEDAVAIAAYCQALVKHLSERYDRGETIPTHHRILTSENKWLAARYGLDAPLMDLATGRRIRVPLAKLVRRTLRELAPHARELGSERELEGVSEILGRGNSADAQLRMFNANRDVVEVVRAIADATEAGGPSGPTA